MTTLTSWDEQLAMRIAEAVIEGKAHEAALKADAQAWLDAIMIDLLPALPPDERVLMGLALEHFVRFLRAKSVGAFDAADAYLTTTEQFRRDTGLPPGLVRALATIREET